MSTTQVSVYIAISLDGYIARPDGDIQWLHEHAPAPEGEDYGYQALMDSVDTVVLGRNSFEKVLGFGGWHYQKPVIVLSRSLTEVPDHLTDRVRIDGSSPAELLARLSNEGCRRIYLDGGRVIQAFLREGLVNDLILTRIPILIGQGLPLFGPLERDIKLELVSCQTWENGLVQTKYLINRDRQPGGQCSS